MLAFRVVSDVHHRSVRGKVTIEIADVGGQVGIEVSTRVPFRDMPAPENRYVQIGRGREPHAWMPAERGPDDAAQRYVAIAVPIDRIGTRRDVA
jgi:hypothetical protein